MQNELQVADAYNIVITAEQKELVKKTVFPDATDAELQLFFFDCTRRGIHPLDKLIHPTKRNGKYTPITSIDLFRQRASESGEHMGTEDAVYTGDPGQKDFAASVTVYKHLRGEKCAFTATARWSEYFPGEKQGFMWGKMPHLMLAKCAEALALRKAFPQQLHGLYTNEEMAQAETPTIKPNIPQVRPRNDTTTISPPTDKYTGEPKQEADGPVSEAVTLPTEGTQQGRNAPPAQPHMWEEKTTTQPAPSAADYCKQRAAEADDLYVDGFIAHLQPYTGTKRNEKGKRPGQFDVDDGAENILLKWVKYFDPDLDISSGLKRVHYKTSTYNNKTQYEVLKIEALE